MLCENRFAEIFGDIPESFSFCPYRICPVGAHVDHNRGVVTGFAIDKGITIAYKRDRSGKIRIGSCQFDGTMEWDLRDIPPKPVGDWADYLRGACAELTGRYDISEGLSGVIEGSLPIGGLSSSAAVTLAFIKALCVVSGISPSDDELIKIAHDAESGYVGVPVGTLDQSCEVLCRKDRLLVLDTLDGGYELIGQPDDMKPYDIAIISSGVEHALVSSGYATRVDELRCGVYALKAYAGMEYGKVAGTSAREVPEDIFERYKDRLPDPWRLRCEHWYSEQRRVKAAVEAWRRGDIVTFGRLSFESGESSIKNWQSGAPEQIKLFDIMRNTDGIYGGRFSGAGFKGSCLAITDPSYREAITEKISREYLKEYPGLKDGFSVTFCNTADGIGCQKR